MSNRIESLDFVRAFAILTVLMAHIVLGLGAPSYLAPLQFGGTGVTLFFVLSGWLLGNQILSEYKKNNSIEIRRFLLKRWIRTLPPYFFILLLTIAQLYITDKLNYFPFEYILFIQNYFSLNFFTVSWSLAVEEQFYLFITPFIIFCFKFSVKYRIAIFLALIVTPFFFRTIGLYNSPYETHIVFDSCLLGVFAAYLNIYHKKIIIHIQNYYIPYLAFCIIFYLSFYASRYNFIDTPSQPDNLTLSFVFAIGLISITSDKCNFKFIKSKFFNYIALRSYGIYLVHPEAIALSKRFFINDVTLFVFNSILISLFLAEIIYVFIEKPCLKNRNKIITFLIGTSKK